MIALNCHHMWQLRVMHKFVLYHLQGPAAQTGNAAETSSMLTAKEAENADTKQDITPQPSGCQVLSGALVEELPTMALPSPHTAFSDISGIKF